MPDGVEANVSGDSISVKGPKGNLSRKIFPEVSISIQNNVIEILPKSESRKTPAMWGLMRALIQGMVEGVSKGFEKKLEIEGVGYRAEVQGVVLQLAIGFSHPVRVEPPEGVAFKVEKNVITISGIDKELVGNYAASIRHIRPPEPYKGKGIRYQGEIIKRKAGKKAVASAG